MFQQIVYMKSKLAEFIPLLDVLDSLHDEIFANKVICNVLQKLIPLFYCSSFFLLLESGCFGTLEMIETSFSN